MQVKKSESAPVVSLTHKPSSPVDDAKSAKSAKPMDDKIKFLLGLADQIYDCQQKNQKSFRISLGKMKFEQVKGELLMCDYIGLVFLRTGNVLKVCVHGNKKPEKTDIISELLKTVPDYSIAEEDESTDKKDGE